jgi:sorbitol-specific phosphotransferase system component IIBC
MEKVAIVSAIVGIIAYAIAVIYFLKHDSDGTHSYGYTVGPYMAFCVALMAIIVTFAIGALIVKYS